MSINRTIIIARNTSLSGLTDCINGVKAYVPSYSLLVIGNGANSASYAPLMASLGVQYAPGLLIKGTQGLSYVHRLVQALLTGPTPGLCIVVNPANILSSTIPSVPSGKQLFGSFDTICGIDPTALATLVATPTIYNHGRYRPPNAAYATPEIMLRDMGTRSSWNMLPTWT